MLMEKLYDGFLRKAGRERSVKLTRPGQHRIDYPSRGQCLTAVFRGLIKRSEVNQRDAQIDTSDRLSTGRTVCWSGRLMHRKRCPGIRLGLLVVRQPDVGRSGVSSAGIRSESASIDSEPTWVSGGQSLVQLLGRGQQFDTLARCP